MRTIQSVLILVFLNIGLADAQKLKLPSRNPEVLRAKYELDYWGKMEFSGIVKSRSDKNVFWIQNDSGDQPRVFAIDSTGNFYQSARYRNYEGISIAGATNVDWEDITMDNKGNLVIADVGNNYNDRKDL